MRSLVFAALAAATLMPAATDAQPGPQSKPERTCFYSRDWQGWKASADGKSMYIRTGPSRLFRVDFVGQCPEINRPAARLITQSRSDLVCSALDLDIRVSADSGGPGVPCLVDRITALSAAEVAALPKALTP